MERSASGPTWAIATPHEEATRAGADALERGGNAVDAALRAATVLAVAYPHMCGVGGDLFALVQRPDGETLAVSSSGRAPSAADPSVAGGADHAMPIRGPIPITVPGAVAGWRALHGTGAVLPWDVAFTRAIGIAIDGVALARGDPGRAGRALRRRSRAVRDLLRRWDPVTTRRDGSPGRARGHAHGDR